MLSYKRKFDFLADVKGLVHYGVDMDLYEQWSTQCNNNFPDKRFAEGVPYLRMVWMDKHGDAHFWFFDLFDRRELARMIDAIEEVGDENVYKIEVVLLKITLTKAKLEGNEEWY